jgi:MtN3 and saliva related transmembrane protein
VHDVVSGIAIIATILGIISIGPQIIKTITTKSARDFSLISIILTIIELYLWLIYAVIIHADFIVLNNVLLILGYLIILYYRIFY